MYILPLCIFYISGAWAAACLSLLDIQNSLGPELSEPDLITLSPATVQRWSEYHAPQPSIVVNVASEGDVSTTVKYCNTHDLTFMVQSGGIGWASTFHLGSCGVIINVSNLRAIEFNSDKTQARIQGGALAREVVDAAYSNQTRLATPTCNCVGFFGAVLGGGLTRVSGLYGWGVDQLVSANLVLASGDLVTVSNTSHPDLWWALLGAGPNFGILTSAAVKAYPTPESQNVAWQGPLVFAGSQLEDLIDAINDLNIANQTQMQLNLFLSAAGPPDYTAIVIAMPFYAGNASSGRQAFAPLFNLKPLSSDVVETPYNHWNDIGDSFCDKGDRKPAYGASFQTLNRTAWRAVYDEYQNFLTQYGPMVAKSAVLAEIYSTLKARQIGSSQSSFSVRHLSMHAVVVPWYESESLDAAANSWGQKTRDLLRSTADESYNPTYINFAHGDEPSMDVYGPRNLQRLRAIKQQWDPQNRFNQWYPIEQQAQWEFNLAPIIAQVNEYAGAFWRYSSGLWPESQNGSSTSS